MSTTKSMTRRDKTRQGKARQDKDKGSKTKQDKDIGNKAIPYTTRHGTRIEARQGQVSRQNYKTRPIMKTRPKQYQARHDNSRHGQDKTR